MKKLRLTALLLITALASSCSLNYVNPNAPTDAQTYSTRDGLISLSVGTRQFYATSGLEAVLLVPGTTAREVKGITTFTNIVEIEAGGPNLPNFNANVFDVWFRMYRVVEATDQIIANVPTVLNAGDAMRTGLLAHARWLKAMALGNLAVSFEQAPVATQPDGTAPFVPRAQLLATAVGLLDEAAAELAAQALTPEVQTRLLGLDFSLVNSVNAMRARFNLMAGNYGAALAAANAVDPVSRSEFKYNTLTPNPIYQSLFIAKNFAPRTRFGLPAALVEDADNRLAFYLAEPNLTVGGDSLKTIRGFFNAPNASIPVYLPDEMRLIRAEANLRLNGEAALNDALADVNAVRTQAAGDPFGVHANLPPYGGPLTVNDLLTEIYKQRSAELFLSGMRLEDSRRFGRPGPPDVLSERSRNFYPYPVQERNTNPNAPNDPAI